MTGKHGVHVTFMLDCSHNSMRFEDLHNEINEGSRPKSRLAFRPSTPGKMLETRTKSGAMRLDRRATSVPDQRESQSYQTQETVLPLLPAPTPDLPSGLAPSAGLILNQSSGYSLPPPQGISHPVLEPLGPPGYDESSGGPFSSSMGGLGGAGSSAQYGLGLVLPTPEQNHNEDKKKSAPPDLLVLSQIYEHRGIKTLVKEKERMRSQSSMSENRRLSSRSRSVGGVPPRPISDTVKPRKLEPLLRRPDVPEVRLKIPDQKGLGGLHLSVNYKAGSNAWQQGMSPFHQMEKDELDPINLPRNKTS